MPLGIYECCSLQHSACPQRVQLHGTGDSFISLSVYEPLQYCRCGNFPGISRYCAGWRSHTQPTGTEVRGAIINCLMLQVVQHEVHKFQVTFPTAFRKLSAKLHYITVILKYQTAERGRHFMTSSASDTNCISIEVTVHDSVTISINTLNKSPFSWSCITTRPSISKLVAMETILMTDVV